ncbi:MAG: hypothetical protein ACI9XZ_004724, partial [Alphaproteobacteria bacterium]
MRMPETVLPAAIKRIFSSAAGVALISLGLAGCYNVDATVTFREDGSAAMTSRLDFPRDAVHVANFYKAIMELRPETQKFFNDGLCQSVEKLAAMNPQKTIDLKAREYTTDNRFGCGFLYQAGDSVALIDKATKTIGGNGNVLKVEQ